MKLSTLQLSVLVMFLTLGCASPPKRPTKPPEPAVSDPTPDPSGQDTDYEPYDLKPARLSDTMRERCHDIDDTLREIADEYRIDPALIQAIVRIESGFNAKARSRVGARGLMQLMPRTARGLDCGNVWDPELNLRCGARLLRRYLDRFDGSLVYALAAYNAGPGNVKAEFGKKRLPRNFRYVEKVLKMRAFFQRGACEAE